MALVGVVLLTALFTAGAFATGTARAGSTPPSSPEIRAEAITKPSVVYIEVTWSGWVYVPATNRVHIRPRWYRAPVVTTSCSGFVANSAGYVVTAGHCVNDRSMTEGGKEALVVGFLTYNVRQGNLTQSQARALQEDIALNGRVEGRAAGSAPARLTRVFQPTGLGNGSVAPAGPNGLTARVVDFKSLRQGDVALLKVSPPHPMPALQVAGQSPQDGTQIVSAGYPGSVAGIVDASQQPSFKSGSVSSTQIVHGVPYIETNADNSPGMSGGPTVDLQGRALGTVSFGPAGEQQAFNFITDTSSVRAILATNGVSGTLSAADLAYREGLADYYAGHYHDAVAKLDAVLAQEPSHALAGEIRAKAVASYPNEVTSTSPWVWGGVGAAALILLAGGLVALLMTRRHRTRPALAGAGPGPGPAPSGPAASGPGRREAGFCPNCGTPHEAQAHFCEKCGQALGGSS